MEKLLSSPIAHRGLHNAEFPENSMASFKNAIEKGYNIEIDVHVLKDDTVVIFHDFSLKRMTGKDGKLKNLTIDDIKGDEYLLPNGEKIPLLKDLLELIDGKVGLLVELKSMSFNHRLERAVYKLIKGKEDWVYIQSFNLLNIKWFNKNANEICRGQLAMRPKNKLLNFLYFFIISGLSYRFGKYHFLAYDAKGVKYKKVAKLVEDKKIKLALWTVNANEKLEDAKDAKADLIIFENITPENIVFNDLD